ncbi:glycosyl hydrolase [Acrocarpospora sp. B8E8]|uniref:glycoside hydrolase family 26 protein n=1 Tax=Acrocarpospora sp. B8E8 TaxID=3153572 RepID=UPI00325EE410
MFIVKRGIIALALVAGCAPASGTGTSTRPEGLLSHETTCVVTDKLIPTCGAWWGIAPDVFTGTRPAHAVERAEQRMGRPADIVHVYHRGEELFPTAEERELAAGRRLLLINWKPSRTRTWAQIARGAVDSRIDALAEHITRTFPGRFFLTIHHEPENDVNSRRGMSAQDYAAMYRHVVSRLRDRGVRNAVTVMTYMGAPNWATKPWFDRLYPGDDVVDWIGLDPYADGRVSDFATLVDKTRPDHPTWPGFYRWTQSRFPGKPIMVSEWGAFERKYAPRFKSDFYASVRLQIRNYPQIKALVYFDSPLAPRGDTRFDTTPEAAESFARLGRERHFTATKVPAQ